MKRFRWKSRKTKIIVDSKEVEAVKQLVYELQYG